MFMRASFQDRTMDHGLKNKKPFIHIRDEEFSFDMLRTGLRGTTQIRLSKQTLFVAVTGFPGADYFNSPAQLLL